MEPRKARVSENIEEMEDETEGAELTQLDFIVGVKGGCPKC